MTSHVEGTEVGSGDEVLSDEGSTPRDTPPQQQKQQQKKKRSRPASEESPSEPAILAEKTQHEVLLNKVSI